MAAALTVARLLASCCLDAVLAPGDDRSATAPLNLMPVPASVQTGKRQLCASIRRSPSRSPATPSHALIAPASDSSGSSRGRRRSRSPRSQLGISKAMLMIHTDHASKEIQELGEDESYVLEVSATGAKLNAPTPLGTMHGLQTFLQLVDVSPDGFAAPAVTIKDQPRFPWRGLMIDSRASFHAARRAQAQPRRHGSREDERLPLAPLRKPGLPRREQEISEAARAGLRRPVLHAGRNSRPDRLRARPRHPRRPGIRHARPQHGVVCRAIRNSPADRALTKSSAEWGVFDPAMDPTNEKTYKFLDKFIGEMTKLFPDHLFPHRRRRSERKAVGRQSEDSGIQEGARHQEQ